MEELTTEAKKLYNSLEKEVICVLGDRSFFIICIVFFVWDYYVNLSKPLIIATSSGRRSTTLGCRGWPGRLIVNVPVWAKLSRHLGLNMRYDWLNATQWKASVHWQMTSAHAFYHARGLSFRQKFSVMKQLYIISIISVYNVINRFQAQNTKKILYLVAFNT